MFFSATKSKTKSGNAHFNSACCKICSPFNHCRRNNDKITYLSSYAELQAQGQNHIANALTIRRVVDKLCHGQLDLSKTYLHHDMLSYLEVKAFIEDTNVKRNKTGSKLICISANEAFLPQYVSLICSI